MSRTFAATTTLIGTMVGAGILAIPYAVSKAGFFLGLIIMAFVAALMILIYLYLGEISLRTKEFHQVTGLAEKYLGKKGKYWMFIATSFGIYAAIIAYLIAEGDSFSFLFFSNASYSIHFAIIFWLAMSLISYLGSKTFRSGEMIGFFLIIFTIVSITIMYFSKISVANLNYISLPNFFTPFGVILFAFLGFSAIPEVERVLGTEKRKIRTVVISSMLFCFIIYTLFMFIVLGFRGSQTPEIATLALGKPFILLGMVTMFMAYLALNNAMIHTFQYDLNKSHFISWLLTILVPLFFLILLNLTKTAAFTNIITIGGVISGGLTAIIILLMVPKAKKLGNDHPYYSIKYSKTLAIIISIFFILAAFLEVYSILF